MLGGDYLKVAVLPVRRPSSIRAQLIMAARPARRCRPGTVAAHRPSAGQNQVGPDHGDKMSHKSLPHNHRLPR
jgi:hypothetical protein